MQAEQIIQALGETTPVPTALLIQWHQLLTTAVNDGDRLAAARVQIIINDLLDRRLNEVEAQQREQAGSIRFPSAAQQSGARPAVSGPAKPVDPPE